MNIYDSFIEGVFMLPDIKDQKDALWSLVCFMRTGVEPEGVRPIPMAWLTTVRPLLETSRARSAAGSKPKKITKVEQSGCEKQANAETNCEQTAEQNANKTPNKTTNKAPNKTETKNKNKNIDLPNGKSRESRGFSPPSPAQVAEYAAESGFPDFDADKFVDFYASKGWMVGRSKMRDWRASVRTWLSRERAEGATAHAHQSIAEAWGVR